MKKVKVKRIVPGSVCRMSMLVTSLPAVILASYMTTRGNRIDSSKEIIVFLGIIVGPIVIAIGMTLLAIIYNWMQKKFGGIEIEIEED